MALTGVKFDSDSGGFVSNCFPVRGLVRRDINEGDGAWLVAHRAEQRRRFKAVLCAKPRTYSRIREERKWAEDQGIQMTASQFEEEEEKDIDQPVLDGYFLMKHCCIEDPSDLCSVNIAGLELSDVKEDDLDIFDNVAYVNAGENYLPFEAFRGFPALRELEMPLNGLRSLKIESNDFPQLEVLDLSYNNLSQDDILTLGHLATLRVLHLTGNNFHTLPQDMSLPFVCSQRNVRRQRFAKLEVLLLDDNKLADISVFAALAGLPKLRHINMEKNQIFCIPQLKCVEGRVVTHDGSHPKRSGSGRKSARRSKSRQQGSQSARVEQPAEEADPAGASSSGETVDGKDTARTEPAPSTAENEATHGQLPPSSTPAEKTKPQDELELDELMRDDFSLGDLTDRITELEEETAKGMEGGKDAANKKTGQEDFVPKALPPFPELRYLNLAHNQIHEEDALLAVAAWPMLVHLVIHNNPLTTSHNGDPPLLKRFLSDRLGIKLQRKHEPRLVKPGIEIQKTPSRMVSEVVPKVPRSTIEERIQQLALEAPKSRPTLDPQPSKSWLLEDRTLSSLDLETSKRMPLPPIPPTPPTMQTPRTQAWLERPEEAVEEEEERIEEEKEEMAVGGAAAPRPDSSAFFMTQVDDQDDEQSSRQKKTKTSKAEGHVKVSGRRAKDKNFSSEEPASKQYPGYELLLDDDSDVEMEVELPKDIQGNVRALKYALGHTLVYRDSSVDLDRVKRTVPEFRRAPVPPAKPHKPRKERVDELLESLRTRSTVDEESLISVLKDHRHLRKRFPDAQHFLSQIQRRYNSVRVSSMKEAADARKGMLKIRLEMLYEALYRHCRHYAEKRKKDGKKLYP